ncbi:hypothetical protein FGO68_gene14410 [Halteria grandinella]|uniref:Uncharacterized protein n=1 Tax=Halteria grandinella TaxID=5974 RepID=A0A8J8T0G0_HALGN|nr:hypothetical protein FGO68_gene14410 [Halteria grandinella]
MTQGNQSSSKTLYPFSEQGESVFPSLSYNFIPRKSQKNAQNKSFVADAKQHNKVTVASLIQNYPYGQLQDVVKQSQPRLLFQRLYPQASSNLFVRKSQSQNRKGQNYITPPQSRLSSAATSCTSASDDQEYQSVLEIQTPYETLNQFTVDIKLKDTSINRKTLCSKLDISQQNLVNAKQCSLNQYQQQCEAEDCFENESNYSEDDDQLQSSNLKSIYKQSKITQQFTFKHEEIVQTSQNNKRCISRPKVQLRTSCIRF